VSLDLGLSESEVQLDPKGVVFPEGQRLAWERVQRIAENEAACFVLHEGAAEKAQRYSEENGRLYSLMATEGAPTLLLSGIPMHRIKGIDPREDTRRKMRALAPVTGRVLDICTGLGYTAIEAAKSAERVETVELDPAVLEVARYNPWSRGLFDNPKIRQHIADACEWIETQENGAFGCIFHDPPTFKIAGDLYSGAMYRQLYRVLRPGGKLFHYIGDPDSVTGRVVSKGVARRLQEAGFARIVRRPEAFGVTAYK
jgi:hypothetical protein